MSAKKLLAMGFCEEVLNRIGNVGIVDELKKMVENKFLHSRAVEESDVNSKLEKV